VYFLQVVFYLEGMDSERHVYVILRRNDEESTAARGMSLTIGCQVIVLPSEASALITAKSFTTFLRNYPCLDIDNSVSESSGFLLQ
jgi:hypothetical protein